ncbi:Cornichon [Dillenia turbinata]|uniref:Cornichon n=1 Tax=Dillenia turbinata TaxID=194707 RepID=A0AAN8YYV5_9MAGN
MEETIINLLGWLLSFVLLVIVLGIVVYQYICLMDLEFDYINPYDLAYRINQVVLPEFVTQAILCSLHLIAGHWLLFLMSLPYLYYNVKSYTNRKHLIDVTEVFNQLNRELKQKKYKIFYLIFLMMLSIFWYADETTLFAFSFATLAGCNLGYGKERSAAFTFDNFGLACRNFSLKWSGLQSDVYTHRLVITTEPLLAEKLVVLRGIKAYDSSYHYPMRQQLVLSLLLANLAVIGNYMFPGQPFSLVRIAAFPLTLDFRILIHEENN